MAQQDRYAEIVASLLAKSGGWRQLPRFKQEVESWRPFWASLRKEDREMFERALDLIWDYADAIESSSEREMNSTEAFLLSVILAQQKIIERASTHLR
ncbi:MAG: hypothetical protein JRN15_10555 [Nitrososphaerota archaeon]|nr:hypothetical protein [Nitrososphaerota archaeon]